MKKLFNDLYHPLFLIIIIGIVFSPCCHYSFLSRWDDQIYVTNNIHRLTLTWQNIYYWLTTPYFCNYIPVSMFSYMFDYAIWQLNPMGYHLQNIIWHLLAVLCIFYCFKSLTKNIWAAFFISLIWGIHPQRVESVAWIAERKDVIATALYFMSILAFFRHKNHKNKLIISYILFLAAMLAKSMAISLPFVLICIEFNYTRSFKISSYIKKFWFFLLTSILFIPITIYAHHLYITNTYQSTQLDPLTLSCRILTICHNYFWYFLKTLAPLQLAPIYPMLQINNPLIIRLSITCIITLITATLFMIKARTWFIHKCLPFTLCYIITLLPVIGVFRLGSFSYADRYSYIPSLFIIAGLILGFNRLINKWLHSNTDKTIFFTKNRLWLASIMLLTCYCLTLAMLSYYQLAAWQNSKSLLLASITHNPPSDLALWILGKTELEDGNTDNAMVIADNLLACDGCGKKIHKQFINHRAYYLKGAVFFKRKLYSKSITYWTKIVNSNFRKIFKNPHKYNKLLTQLAQCYILTHQHTKAISCYQKLLKHTPSGTAEYHFYKGMTAYLHNKPQQALLHFKHALSLNPDDQQAKHNVITLEEILKKQNKSF